LVFVLLVSIGVSWFAVKMEKARRQKEAVEAIEKAGLEVWYEHEWGSRQPDAPQWLRELLGDDFFVDVVTVLPSNPGFGDDGATHFEGLTNLRALSLHRTQITDAGLKHLEGLTNLAFLFLADTQITDAGLEHLEGLGNLEELSLEDTQVTPEGVKKLQEALPDCQIICDERRVGPIEP
jgi:hypothetical protein